MKKWPVKTKRTGCINKQAFLHKLSDPKIRGFFFVVLIYFCPLLSICPASDQLISATPEPVQADQPVYVFDKKSYLDAEYQENLFKAEVAWLRQKKAKYIRENRVQHIRNTERLYRKAVRLYRRNRLERAQEAFRQVEHLMPNYKSSRKFLNIIIDKRLTQMSERLTQYLTELARADRTASAEEQTSFAPQIKQH